MLMEPSCLRKFLSLLLFFVFLPFFSHSTPWEGLIEVEAEFSEAAVAQRLEAMSTMAIRPRRDPVALSYIRNYVTRSRRSAELIIGRSVLYFPMFEEYLEKYKLPKELKYLPVVESALNPRAVSRAGAGGLWQFMPGTGRLEGLNATRYIDERFDPAKSTNAAMRHLTRLYDMFGDWELSLAAYNSGSGTVTRAMKRGRSQNYWKIQRFLPRETRNYVPAFYAAAYLCEHFAVHGITPNLPDLDLQINQSIKIYNGISFYEIAAITGLSIETIETLNPAYIAGYIPENPDGYFLYLPRRVVPAIMEYLAAKLPDNSDPEPVMAGPVALSNTPQAESWYLEHIYTVEPGEELTHLNHLAARLKCTPQHLRVWNPGNTPQLVPGQQWKYYGPKAWKRMETKKLAPVEVIATLPTRLPEALSYASPLQTLEPEAIPGTGYLCVKLTQPERLPDIAKRYEGVTIDNLRRLNRVMGNPVFKQGHLVRIREF